MLSKQLREKGLAEEAKLAEQLERAVADLFDRIEMVRFALTACASVLDGASQPDHLDDHACRSVGETAVRQDDVDAVAGRRDDLGAHE